MTGGLWEHIEVHCFRKQGLTTFLGLQGRAETERRRRRRSPNDRGVVGAHRSALLPQGSSERPRHGETSVAGPLGMLGREVGAGIRQGAGPAATVDHGTELAWQGFE